MTEREIASVEWHEHSHHIDVTYLSGQPDRLEGPHQLAAELAADAGLSLVPTHNGTVRWVRPNPDDWWS